MVKKRFSLFLSFLLLFLSLLSVACVSSPFTVTFHANGGTLVSGSEVQTVTLASQIKPPVYERKGYGLTGFDKVISNINSDTDVYAVWGVLIYKLNFDANGGTLSQTEISVRFDSLLPELPKPTRDGQVFSGWYIGETPIFKGFKWEYDLNQTATAKWEEDDGETFSIEYDLAGGTCENLKTFYKTTTETFTLPSPTKTGYEFKGWLKNGETEPRIDVSIEKGSTGNLSYKAVFDAKDYKLYLDANGGDISVSEFDVTFDQAIPNLPTPQNADGVFVGWFIDLEPLVNGQAWKYDSNKTAIAKYKTEDVYAINYNLDGGTLYNPIVSYKTTDESFWIGQPSKDGYKFKGWLKNGETEPKEEIVIEKGSTGDVTLTAVWEKYYIFRIELSRNALVAVKNGQYTFKMAYCTVNGQQSVSDIYFTAGETIQLPIPSIIDTDDYFFSKNSEGEFQYWVIDYVPDAVLPDNVGRVVYSGETITEEFDDYIIDGVITVRPKIKARYIA